TLVGIALGAVLGGFSSALALMNPDTFDRMRFWGAGTITDRPEGTVTAILPVIGLGLLVTLLCLRSLNAVALGDELAT
ncbi:iron chelate uptake ABC transporter family permease subunit, partial [Leucobacter sp. M11]|uniref:iron chelate uptake ABC transporter family permease subunit n=1 Tax=Leucobacter sp. M11 TaxID=2993565 RepID=UPI002D7EF62A